MAPGLADGLPARGDPAARTTSSSTRSSTSRSSWCAPTTWACGRSRTPAATAASRSSRAGGRARAGSSAPSTGGATAPTARTPSSPRAKTFAEHNLQPEDLDLTPVRCEVWGGCAWINLDDDAPPLRQCIEPFATILDAWKVESMRTEWWYACRLPVNWKLAEEAFMEQYHVIETHPQLVIPERFPPRNGGAVDPGYFIDAELHYLRTHERGHGRDGPRQRRARGRGPARTSSCPTDPSWPWRPGSAPSTTPSWTGTGTPGRDIPDLNELEARGLNEPMGYCFPHYFVLPMYSSASSYRFRPLGPEETLMEIWSLTRFPEGDEPDTPAPPELVGVRRSTLAAHPRPGLLQPAPPAAGPARQGLRVHAPVRAGRGGHRQLRADRRRLPGRPSLREAAARRCRRST